MRRSKWVQPKYKVGKSKEIYRLFLFVANLHENKKEKMEHEIGNWDYDFGVRPTEHSARVMCSKSYLVLHITYLAESLRITLRIRILA